MTASTQRSIPTWKKIAYGSGEWSLASFGTLRQIFYAIFLTDVVGLEPRLASFAALIGIIWDAINDPIVGTLSDKMRTKWGRRRPFLLFFSIPYGLSFVALWWAPPFENQYLLAAIITLTFMLSDTLQTLVSVPFYSLTPEITPDYDERTSLTGYRMFFNLLASLVTAVAAPAIVSSALSNGATQQQGYLMVSSLFGGLAIVPMMLIFFFVKERDNTEDKREEDIAFMDTIRMAWSNIPFRFASGIYMLNWVTFDLVGLVFPFFLVYWVSKGDLLATALGLPIGSAMFACLLVTSVIFLPFWVWLAKKIGKQRAYIAGMIFWAGVQVLIFAIQPGQVTFMLVLAVLAGISVSTAHVLPDAIFPDVIEWDELRTGQRREGIYYGVKNFIRKLTGAFAIFLILQVLGWFGYQTPPEGSTFFTQPAPALFAIRFLIGPMGAVILICAVIMAWFYPLTKEKHARVRSLLARKKQRRGLETSS